MVWLLLVAYVALPLAAYARSRSLAWTVIALTVSVSVFGLGIGVLHDLGHNWDRTQLQVVLLVAFAVVAVAAFLRPGHRDAPLRRQLWAIGLPVLALGAFISVMALKWTAVPGFLTPVSFLMGHAQAEDNAVWLDFTAQYASGLPIDQWVPLGGPLQLVLVFVATLMAAVSQVLLGGYNEVAVAANSVIFGQYFLVAISPLALAPMAEAWMRRPVADGAGPRARIPLPYIWLGALVLVVANLIVTAYGHLTFQYAAVVTALWCSTFLVASRLPRARLYASMGVAAAMTVWLPLNVLAAMLVAGWLIVLVSRGVTKGWRALDPIGIGLVVLVAIGIWLPVQSSLAFLFSTAGQSASGLVAGMGGGVHAGAMVTAVPGLVPIWLGLDNSGLFAAGGGTEVTGPILAILAAAAVLAAAIVASRQSPSRREYVRLLGVGLLGLFAVIITVLDQWSTGGGPHYGAQKFTFLVTMVVMASALPVGLLLVDPRKAAMSLPRWAAVAAVVYLLIVDAVLPRSVAALRPQQWSPPIPFENPQSYWWPADVNGGAVQPIRENPVACVYLPQGAKAPSAILDSQLSDPQRVYACTRQLAGLAGVDHEAQPIVDWLRREWLTNTRAWANVYGYLAGMPDYVLDKPVILLDDGSNVIGLETMRSLLERYPAEAGLTAEEIAARNAGQ